MEVGVRLPGWPKKRVEAAVLAAGQKKSFSGLAAKIYMAQEINRRVGTALRPWELDGISEEWMSGLELWIFGLPKVAGWKNEVEENLTALRERLRKQRLQ